MTDWLVVRGSCLSSLTLWSCVRVLSRAGAPEARCACSLSVAHTMCARSGGNGIAGGSCRGLGVGCFAGMACWGVVVSQCINSMGVRHQTTEAWWAASHPKEGCCCVCGPLLFLHVIRHERSGGVTVATLQCEACVCSRVMGRTPVLALCKGTGFCMSCAWQWCKQGMHCMCTWLLTLKAVSWRKRTVTVDPCCKARHLRKLN